jgi:alkanesulfonate monooxygenase SsuD/methylene tetrahydromethanopterin reductase-like flavin-dependent oxidoreductase (luciferase family)
MWRVSAAEARAAVMAGTRRRVWMGAAEKCHKTGLGRHIMKIGLFDHVEDGERPLAQLYDERLEFAVAAEAAGFYCLHVAEHHATPLNLVPVPGVYLGAVARLTTRLRFGPLVYLLPLYSPLRLIEEICMLDHLSHGRFDIGVGRGVSPYELEFHNVMHDDSRDIFFEAYDCIKTGLTSETFSYKSSRYLYNDVPIAVRPLQQPHPPFWYASSSDVGSAWAGEHGLHYVTLGANAMAKAHIATFKAALAKRGSVAQPKPEFPGGVVIGLQRHICVADTDAEAHRIFKPAMDVHLKNLNWLRVKKNDTGLTSRLKIPHGTSYEEMVAHGGIVAGSPATVRAELERQARDIGFNYLLTYLFLGTMSLKEAMRSLELFRTEVMPHLEKL